MSPNKPDSRKVLIENYFAACNDADPEKIKACFTPDAELFFPPGIPEIPWRGADLIAQKWAWFVKNLGCQWTIENMIVDSEGRQAVVEWTYWRTEIGEILRGDEWYLFDEKTGLIREIRAYYASPVHPKTPVHELAGFDYQGRGYHLGPKAK